MQLTIRTKIHDHSFSHELEKMAEQMSRAKRSLFVRYGLLGEKIVDLKREFILSHALTARQFNAIAFEVKGLLKAQKELKKELIKKAEKKLKKIKEKIKKSQKDLLQNKDKKRNQKIKFKLHQHQRQLTQKERELKKYHEQLKKPSVCFGEKELFKKQFHLKENGYQTHDQWKKDWKEARDLNFALIGSKDESFGNQSCQFLPGRLKLRLTHSLAKELGREHIEIPLQVTYRENWIHSALANKQAIHYRFLRQVNGYWYVHITLDLPETQTVTEPKYGALGIDLNPSCIAATHVDSYGNLSRSWQISIDLRGRTSNQVEAILGDHCAALVAYAQEQKIPIVIEELDFENKKQNLRSRKMNRMLSQFAYSKFNSMMTSRCYREGVQIKEVNPAYTSTLGKVKFSLGYGLSTHMAAAMAIARRGLGFGERLCAKSKLGLSLPVRNRRKHPWSDWSKLNPLVFPEAYLRKDGQRPERPQNEKSSSSAFREDLTRIRKSSESEVMLQ